jgi:SWI/SNF-related matrix-associated actin-dependent regulator 1 of chromatin subfamily A
MSRRGCILALDLALGKTAIASACALLDLPVLVVCPASAVGVWVQEAQRLGLYCETLSGIDGPTRHAQMWIMSYQMLDRWAGSFALGMSDFQPQTLIADEAHMLTNKKVTWAKAWQVIHAERRILLTATPMRNRLRSLWGLLNCACPRAFGSDYEFRRHYCGATDGQWGLEDGEPTNQDELAERLKEVVIKLTRADVQLPVPEHTRRVVTVPIGAYAIADAMRGMSNKPGDQIKMLTQVRHAIGGEKLTRALHDHVIPEINRHTRTIVWVWHKDIASDLVHVLRSYNHKVDVLIGETHSAARQRVIDEWRATSEPAFVDRLTIDKRVLVASIGAASSAISLTTADCAVFLELDWAPLNLVQAEKRHHRFGSIYDHVDTVYIVGDTPLEKHMIGALLEKADASEEFLGRDGQLDQMQTLLGSAELTEREIMLRFAGLLKEV